MIEQMKKIKMLVMDVDGTLTDGKIYIGPQGEVMKAFNVKDGYAIKHILPEMGIIPVIITGRTSAIVEYRAKELDITELYQGVSDKPEQLKKVAEKFHLTKDQIAYIGDDVNDLECIKYCGFSACPNDAVEEIKQCVDYVCNANGGDGAVREMCSIKFITNNKYR